MSKSKSKEDDKQELQWGSPAPSPPGTSARRHGSISARVMSSKKLPRTNTKGILVVSGGEEKKIQKKPPARNPSTPGGFGTGEFSQRSIGSLKRIGSSSSRRPRPSFGDRMSSSKSLSLGGKTRHSIHLDSTLTASLGGSKVRLSLSLSLSLSSLLRPSI